jgi:serine/threonine-protein kinase
MTGGSPNSATMPLIGARVAGKYELVRLIGQGGMGAVFEARHVDLDKRVAIKVMLADTANAEAIGRFKREGRSAAQLRSQHIVDVQDVGEENGYAYMILELLDGEDLGKVLETLQERRQQLPIPQAVGYVLEALVGVQLAHQAGIVHRDLKPSNLFLARQPDGTQHVKVLDFGISKSSTLTEKPEALTSTKAMLGSPLYMSPEQLKSSKSVDPRSDIWAMGVILYELLTGTLPFMGETLGELFANIIEARPTPPSTRRTDMPPQLEAIIMRCLRANRDERFGSVAELRAALVPFAQATTLGLGPGHTSPNMAAMGMMPPNAAMTPRDPYSMPQPGYQQMQGTGGGSRPMVPVVGAVTGSGVHPPVVKGTVPLGSNTPMPPWRESANIPKSTNWVFVGLIGFAILGIIGAGAGGAVYYKSRQQKAVAEQPQPPPPVTATTPLAQPDPPTAVSAPPAVSVATTATATTSATAKAGGGGGGGHVAVRPKDPTTNPTPATPPPPAPVPKPPGPTTKPTGPGFEDTR